MNILFYLYQFPAFGGIETVTATLANYLSSRGCRVWILSHRGIDSSCVTLKLNDEVSVLHFPPDKNSRLYIEELIEKEKINLIVFQDSYARIEHNLDGLWNQIPIIVCEHNAPLSGPPPKLLRVSPRDVLLWLYRRFFKALIYARRERYLYSRCRYYVLLSERFFGEFRAVTRIVDWRKLKAIPNPIAGSFLTGDSLGGENWKDKIVLCSATFDYRKGQDMLLEIWRNIVPHLPKGWKLVLAGDGPTRAELERFVEEKTIPCVEFLGYVADMKPLYAKASILVMPSRVEGWSLVLHEAMSQGCVPLVFNSYSAVYDVVDEGENAIIVPSFDKEAFGRELTNLILDENKRKKLAESTVAKAQSFTVARIGELWLALFGECARENEGIQT